MRVGVIINPVSGRDGHRSQTAIRRVALARTLCDARAVDAEIVLTRGRGDATVRARQFVDDRCDRIIAWGGDGTIVEAAEALIRTDAALGIVRSGSGDGFARGLGIPARPAEALDIAVSAKTRSIDVGCLGGRHFLNVAGIGFDAAVARAFNARRRRGLVGYLTEVFRCLYAYVPQSYDLEIDGVRESGPRFLLAFANGPEYGNGIAIAPDADPSDGELDLVMVDAGSPLRQFWRARRLAIGRTRPAAGITRRRVRHASISGAELICHLDGETCVFNGSIEVRVEHGALKVAAPISF
jgi:diacylglycerol kinase (ATP)